MYIICVGTTVNERNKTELLSLKKASKEVGKVLKPHDLVILRSTVAIGTTRETVIPILEQESKLKVGKDFFVAFAPERTIEGKALEELRTLPQVIGGYNKQSFDYAAQLFQPLAHSIVAVSTLEAAETVKLLNNTYRDVTFSFANEVANICDGLGLDTLEIIHAANEGYPRDTIPYPSPGVGGTCLVKDPYILIESAKKAHYKVKLPGMARTINKSMIDFVYQKVHNFLKKNGKDAHAKIFVIGLAFKGFPETSDMRHSTSLDIVRQLQKIYTNIHVYDPVVQKKDIKKLGLPVVSTIRQGFQDADCVLVLNNHPSYRDLDIYSLTKLMNPKSLLFDGWGIYNQQQLSPLTNVTYEGLGVLKKSD